MLKRYQLLDRSGKIQFIGTYLECLEKEEKGWTIEPY